MAGVAALLGRNVQRLRVANGWTQQDLADRIGVTGANISRLEAGKHWSSDETLDRLAAIFGVPVAYLFADGDSPIKTSPEPHMTIRQAIKIVNDYEGLISIKLRRAQVKRVKNSLLK